jgi:hypothetical protein
MNIKRPKPWIYLGIEQRAGRGTVPGIPLILWVPTWVKNKALTLLQLVLLCIQARPVFSPALKMYFAFSKVMMMVGSVSDDKAEITLVDHLATAISGLAI